MVGNVKDEFLTEIDVHRIEMSKQYLVYIFQKKTIKFYNLIDNQHVSISEHSIDILNISLSRNSVNLAFIDIDNSIYLYNPLKDVYLQVNVIGIGKIKGIMWDHSSLEQNFLIIYDQVNVFSCHLVKQSIYDEHAVVSNYVTKIGINQEVLYVKNGQLLLLDSNIQIHYELLTCYTYVEPNGNLDTLKLNQSFEKCLYLNRFKLAWNYCVLIDEKDQYEKLALKSLIFLNVDISLQVYRHLKKTSKSMVFSTFKNEEEMKVLCGHIYQFNGKFNEAQNLFMNSSKPNLALQMRRNLLQWDEALRLAQTISPGSVELITLQYAQELELHEDTSKALVMYNTSIENHDSFKGVKEDIPQNYIEICKGGISRCLIQSGQIREGINMALELDKKDLKLECAEILEKLKQWNEAANLYEKCNIYDKAAECYIRNKNWEAVERQLEFVHQPRLFYQFARAKEASGELEKSVLYYKKAEEYDHAIRIYLDKLNNPEDAVILVQQTDSINAAKRLARYFENTLQDYASAVQFLVLSKCHAEAFKIAQMHNQMEVYSAIVGDNASIDDFKSLSLYFYEKKDYLRAANFSFKCKEYKKALINYISASKLNEKESIEGSIKTVGVANDDQLVSYLIEFLLGDVDGIPKDARYLFKLYMALKKYPEAAKTAIIIANEEQADGNFRNARDTLLIMELELRKQGIDPSSEMLNNLMLLQSYLMIKVHAVQKNHMLAARLLIRIANNISKFNKHSVKILTFAVLQCNYANLNKSAFKFAATLLQPDKKEYIDKKHRKMIELVVRKQKSIQILPTKSPCCYCKEAFDEMELLCPKCEKHLPYCIITGCHYSVTEILECPNCHYGSYKCTFEEYLENVNECPMCCFEISIDSLIWKKIS
ncbi:WD repeat-containing protein 19 [Intoshia linei]|uniref:WD repeat-containing protein 19 n=1 Tax=Intoshia linei TaxID=1819745 RepID=A0A177BAY5_9BILA|nr:WD repeat-containing protein 19 [Intoshia linei]